ncbi:unnamed protein product [Ectocarpus sp. 12 AP-2014]
MTVFGTELIRAVETNSTLELVSGTFFLGNSQHGSKIYIRPFYKQLGQLIFSGAKSGEMWNTVVTGTPGIGKSTFSFYLLYLLRREGKTVVYDLNNTWYRFSDEGVVRGTRDNFLTAGYLDDDTEAWHLSDPEWKPYPLFAGATVVFVSPKQDRVKMFLKESKKSRQLFMPVWGMDELLECREAVYPEMSVVDTKEAFDRVGGVARAVFDAVELRQHLDKMSSAANQTSLDLLQAVLSQERGNIEYFSADGISDTLLHMIPIPGTNFEYFDVTFASDHARSLTVRVLPAKEARDLAAHVADAFANERVGKKYGPSRLGELFEDVVHNAIGGTKNGRGSDGRSFGIRKKLRDNGDGIFGVYGRNQTLKFDFKKRTEFPGFKLPDKLEKGVYYRPTEFTFAAIDSVGVNGDGDTLFFFQVQSADVPPVNGTTVKNYWDDARASIGVSKCVFVYVIPHRDTLGWKEPAKICDKPWLKGEITFEADCSLCVVEAKIA